ncbi:MAG: hypothetical protein ACR2LX_03420 [Jatrophihabitans sp.]
MFTTGDRDKVRATLLRWAREDPNIVGAAITGSAARGVEDDWSDVDLLFGVGGGSATTAIRDRWSAAVYAELGAVHHFDIVSGPAVYRAFLLPDLLEIDLGFAAAGEFGPRGSGEFRVVFGDPVPRVSAPADVGRHIGFCWHHVRHARACIDRDQWWQAEHWIAALRTETIALACLRLGLASEYAKGADALPVDLRSSLLSTLVRELTRAELDRALGAAADALIVELHRTDPDAADRLHPALSQLAGIASS